MKRSSSPLDPWQWAAAPWRLALEGRCLWEGAALLAIQPLLALAPRGDGHQVLVLPMLLGNDLSTWLPRESLSRLGYQARPWNLGTNRGPVPGLMAACRERLQALHRQDGRKLSLIGWSLGGLYARELARQAPELVRLVITLGSPVTGDPAPAEFWKLHAAFTGQPMGLGEPGGSLAEPPPVPTTAIFSRSDGIVPWANSQERAGPLTENIEIESSHLGLGVNPMAIHVIANRLAQPEGAWRPYADRQTGDPAGPARA